MKFEKLMRYKGLTLATLSLVIAFVLYLLLSGVIESKSLSDVKYAASVSNLMDQVQPDMDAQDATGVATSLSSYISGGNVRVAGINTSVAPISSFFSPNSSNADQVLQLLQESKFAEASTAAATLSESVQKRLEKKSSLSQLMKVAAAILAVLLYLLVIVPMILRLSEKEETVAEVVKESKGIMNTVNEGLFLLDKDQNIGIEQSASLKQMFKSERDLEGDFFDFISQYVSQHTVQTAREYLGLLYGERVKEKLVKDLNPLNEVEINLVRRDGSYENRYLDFQFNRVVEDEKLSHILVSVTDETKRVLLERELEETKQEQEAQIDLLMSVLHIDKKQLTSFFDTAEADLNEVNNTLEGRGHGDAEIRSKITNISRIIHKLKGDATALGLHKFEFAAHELEEELANTKNQNETLTGKELLPSLTKLKDLFSELKKMQNIVAKLGDYGPGELLDSAPNVDTEGASLAPSVVQQVAAPKEDGIAGALTDLAATVSKRNGKRAHLSAYGLSRDGLPASVDDDREESLKSIAVQLVRNSIVHGALSPEERLAAGKSDFINIGASLTETDDAHVLLIRDDGEGFDNQKILDRALELGIFKPEQLAKIDIHNAFKLVFQPGFTSLDEADLDGGRGVGLDLVHQMIKEIGGTIAVQHKPGRYCQFKITLPKSSA